jgi:uncharacterized protein (TIGR02687 family)
MKAPDFMRLKLEDCRNLSRELQLLYLYHNQIDARGDKRETEGTVFQAAEDALSDLLKLIKKLNGANFSHILITADHGFLYQDRRIEESDFLTVSAKGEKIVMQDRRFVLGKGLVPQDSLHTFTSKQLGLDGDLEIQIPKSIHRLRLQGSGSRFVHGGATLQEVVIPVLKVYKSRQSDTSQVEVEILRGASSIITSGQLSVTFYQCMAVTDKVKPRFLRAGLYSKSGVLLSETHQVNFDLTSEKPREREMSLRFILTRSAEEFNGQEIFLRLEELVEGTTLYKDYRSQSYVLRRSFTSDFDF